MRRDKGRLVTKDNPDLRLGLEKYQMKIELEQNKTWSK